MKPGILTSLLVCLLPGLVFENSSGLAAEGPPSYAAWSHGPSGDPSFFPIAVWLQNPAKAERYRQAGINVYVGLWRGPTEEQLALLKKAGMKVICHLNDLAAKQLDDPTIIGWMHGDEPDNAQPLGQGRGYGPPIPPERIIHDYQKIRAADPTRPVLLNLGQGVAWDGWHGRGVRTRHPEDYREYVKGCDIVSFDIYPAVHDKPEVAGKLEYVARGVERLVEWTDGRKIVWNCLECTRISHPTAKATPHQVRAEAWMSLIHGSRGLIYFVHEWQPKFNESALLDDPEMLRAVTDLNRQITRLAPVLNSPSLPRIVKVSTDHPQVPVAVMAKRLDGALHLFAVCLRNDTTRAVFSLDLPVLTEQAYVEVLDENRRCEFNNGQFTDTFGPWDTHLYRIHLPSRAGPGLPGPTSPTPLPRAHAHNDYEHPRPLLDALDNGFCSIEADVHLVDGQLLVAHDRGKTSSARTLESLYLAPLRERVRKNQGRVYPDGPVCWLFIDLKTEAEATYGVLRQSLEHYADMLTRFEGDQVTTNAILVVVTGNRPRAAIAGQSRRLCAYDGLLADLDANIPSRLVPVISEQWTRHFRWRGSGTIPAEDLGKLKQMVKTAHAQEKRVRFWGAPDQAGAWRVLLDAEVDLINTDNLTGLRQFLGK
jgi:hypothetical protein